MPPKPNATKAKAGNKPAEKAKSPAPAKIEDAGSDSEGAGSDEDGGANGGDDAQVLHSKLLQLRAESAARSTALEEARAQHTAKQAGRDAEIVEMEAEGEKERRALEDEVAEVQRKMNALIKTKEAREAQVGETGPPLEGEALITAAAAIDSEVAAMLQHTNEALANVLRGREEVQRQRREREAGWGSALSAAELAEQAHLLAEQETIEAEQASIAAWVKSQTDAISERANQYASELQSHLDTSVAACDRQMRDQSAEAAALQHEIAEHEREGVAQREAQERAAVQAELSRLQDMLAHQAAMASQSGGQPAAASPSGSAAGTMQFPWMTAGLGPLGAPGPLQTGGGGGGGWSPHGQSGTPTAGASGPAFSASGPAFIASGGAGFPVPSALPPVSWGGLDLIGSMPPGPGR